MKKYLKLIFHMVILCAIWYVIFGGCMLAFSKIASMIPNGKEWISQNFFVSYAITSLLGCFCIYLYFKFQKINMFQFCGYNNPDLKKLILAIGYGIIVGVFSSCFTYEPLFKQWFPQISGYFIYLTSMSMLPYGIIVGCDSVFKETLFRGAMLNELRKNIPLGIAIVIQAIFYGLLLFYSDFPTRVFGFAGNILFALIYLLAGSIWASIAVQFSCYLVMYGFTQIAVLKDFAGQYGIVLIIISLIVMLIPVYLYFVKHQTLIPQKDSETQAISG